MEDTMIGVDLASRSVAKRDFGHSSRLEGSGSPHIALLLFNITRYGNS
jgi:hypothetical protein